MLHVDFTNSVYAKKMDDSKGQPAIFAHADIDTVGHRAVLLNSLCKLNKTTV